MSCKITGRGVEGGGEIDRERAMLNSGSVFTGPGPLCGQRRLTRGQRIEILRR